ncbi:mitochondrial 37S ribosomal protein rsm10 [Steccherinum ochraceum]|uniref:Small ribosomal subunit protein uS10m n=1 Tax=Steccherinum ochraceum TaxID=92696 RepID=A0A4V2MVF6_9APHY|nr:mitochondrial 37S ribosomal protein rsm10 [Steccherinum ochraceum]
MAGSYSLPFSSPYRDFLSFDPSCSISPQGAAFLNPSLTYQWLPLDTTSAMPPPQPEHLLAADALLGLSVSPPSPLVSTTFSPTFSSPAFKRDQRYTPLGDFSTSPHPYWNLTDSISPILRSSSPNLHGQDTTPSSGSRGRRSNLSQTVRTSSTRSDGSEARRLSLIHGLSPLSDISTFSQSSNSASQPATTPSAPASSASASQSNQVAISPVVTTDDWERPPRYATRARARAIGNAGPLVDCVSPALLSLASSSMSPETSVRRQAKRPRTEVPKAPRPLKKPRIVVVAEADEKDQEDEEDEDEAGQLLAEGRVRTFPDYVPIDNAFASWYRRFPVPSYTRTSKRGSGLSGAAWNSPYDVLDLYTPRFVKGRGTSKVGLCPICIEPVKRGGTNKKFWAPMKQSAYKCNFRSSQTNVHILPFFKLSYDERSRLEYPFDTLTVLLLIFFYAGISPTTRLPFSPPVAHRTVKRDNPGKHEKSQMRQGKCHRCNKWVDIEGKKDVDTKVAEIFWWKHAHSCHKGSTIAGETDIFIQDEVLDAALAGEMDEDEDDEDTASLTFLTPSDLEPCITTQLYHIPMIACGSYVNCASVEMYRIASTSLARPCRSALASVSRRAWIHARTLATTTEAKPPSNAPPPNLPQPATTRTPTHAPFSEADYASQVVDGRALLTPYHHPRTHSIPVALIHFRSYHLPLLNLFIHFASHAASALGIPTTKPASLPTQRRLWTVIKGPFVHKKAQENFERKTHKRVVKMYDADQGVVDKYVKYLEHHALAGVGVRVVRWHRAPMGVGEKTVEAVRRELRGPRERTSAEKVKSLGEKIVKEETKAAAAAGAGAKEGKAKGGKPKESKAKEGKPKEAVAPKSA